MTAALVAGVAIAAIVGGFIFCCAAAAREMIGAAFDVADDGER